MEINGKNPFLATLVMLGVTIVALIVGVVNSVVVDNFVLFALNLALAIIDSVFFGFELGKFLQFNKLQKQEKVFREIVQEFKNELNEPFGEFNNDKGEE